MPYDPNNPKTFVDPRVWEGHRQDKDGTGGCAVRVEVLEVSGDGSTVTVRAKEPGVVTTAGDSFTVATDTVRSWWQDPFPASTDMAGAGA
ncbi:hypothetical protein [Streptomyces sp. t99]|uniref:hypothetical protein n=1 Tax=Streptomyces sp. t99 TaxID=1828172 RepID=UPI000BFB9CF7|nr:hypothetical protein [Streptomyces sp. t99]